MIKIVPDPPLTIEAHHALEDLLIQISEYLTCAVAITHQNTLLPIAVHTQALTLTTMHEIEAARSWWKWPWARFRYGTDWEHEDDRQDCRKNRLRLW